MNNYYKIFSKKKKSFLNDGYKITNKQKFGISLLIVSLISNFIYAQTGGASGSWEPYDPTSISDIILSSDSSASPVIASFFINSVSYMEIFLSCLSYISNVQLETNNVIASTPLGNSSMFSNITSIITIFASVGCAYRIVKHFLKTERYDNANAILGLFGYAPILVLFMFSGSIVNWLVSSNSNINSSAVANICTIVGSEVEEELQKDFEAFHTTQKDLEEAYDVAEWDEIAVKVTNRLNYYTNEISLPINSYVKYFYYSIFGGIIATVLAIPTVIMTLMVKILLTISILGAKIVFLLAFIPGFENTWRTYLLNILNVLLWIPIFNVIISFIISLVSSTITNDSLNTGQIIWLSIVAIICAYQAVSLTTSAAQMIVNGAGAGMAGALGSMASMNATSMVVGAGSAVVAGGIAAGTMGAMGSSKMPTPK